MNLTKHTDYGLRVLMTLASTSQRVTTGEIASTFGISLHHLQKVVRSLQQAGWVEAGRGRGGGLTLRSEPAAIVVGDVVRRLEPHLHVVECFGGGTCALLPACGLKGALYSARASFLASLDAVTLADITPGAGSLLRAEA